MSISVAVSGCDSVDSAIEALQRGVHSIEEIQRILEGVRSNLDRGEYRSQVEEIIGRVGQTAQLTGQAFVDFISARVVEDLQRVQAARRHQTLPPRVPVLATVALPEIDYTSQSRTTVKVVGWNLDVAKARPTDYQVRIVGKNDASRDVDTAFVSFQGQYQVTVDVSSSGVPLKRGDKKLVFAGYEKPFEIPVVRSDEGVLLSQLIIETGQDIDEKDADIEARFVVEINGAVYLDCTKGRGTKWPDNVKIVIRVVPRDGGSPPCSAEFVEANRSRFGPVAGRVESLILSNQIRSDGSWDPSCSYKLVEPRLANAPPLTGQGTAKLTIIAQQDGSGWAGRVRLLAVVDGQPSERQLLSETFVIHRDGRGGTAEFRGIHW